MMAHREISSFFFVRHRSLHSQRARNTSTELKLAFPQESRDSSNGEERKKCVHRIETSISTRVEGIVVMEQSKKYVHRIETSISTRIEGIVVMEHLRLDVRLCLALTMQRR